MGSVPIWQVTIELKVVKYRLADMDNIAGIVQPN